jgi:Rrf2 family iron-sulfur cluster assembly transcriptional regulator
MLKLSKKMLFAIEAVVDIAYHAGSLPVQNREITRRQGIPRRYLEQVLQHLVRAGILVGVRGPRGGYRLARERRRISVGEISRVVLNMETAGNPIEDESGSAIGHKVVRPLWQGLQNEIMDRINTITVEDLCLLAHKSGIESEVHQKLDFTI